MFSEKGTSFFNEVTIKTKGWFNNQPFLNQPKPKLNQKPKPSLNGEQIVEIYSL